MKKYINFLILTLLLALNAEARVFNSTEEITLQPAVGFTVQIDSASVTASQPLKLGASKEFVTGAIDLASAEVTGILPSANQEGGGTADGINTSTNTVYTSGSASPTLGQVLTAISAGAATWQTPAATGGGVADGLSTTTLPVYVSGTVSPTLGQVLTATSGVAATWQTPTAVGGSGLFDDVTFTSGTTPSTPLAGNVTTYADSTSGLLSQVDSNGVVQSVRGFKQSDVLTNSSFEDSHAGAASLGWTCVGGTAAVETTERVSTEGAQSLAYTVTGSTFSCSQTYDCSKSPAIAQGFTAYVNSTSDIEVCGFDGTNDLNCVAPTSDDSFKLALAENNGGGTCGIKIKSDASITDVIYIDGIKFTEEPYRFVDVQNTTGWTPYVPIFSGLGTPTMVETFQRRVGDTLEVKGFFTTGTVAGTEAQIGLPAGLVIDTDRSTTGANLVGTAIEGAAAASYFGAYLLGTGGDSFLNVSHQTSSANAGSTVNGSDIGSSTNLYFSAKVPILGWSATSANVAVSAKTNAKKWTAFTPTFDGGGTLGATDCKYRRVLDSMDIDCLVTTGTVDGTTAALVLPDSLQVDASVIAANQVDFVGHAYSISGGSSAPVEFYGFLDSDEPTKVYITSTRSGGAWEKRAANGILSSSAAYSIHLRGIAINGWNLEDTFLSMFPFDRFQTKLLSADVTTTTDISDLQFNNLVIGKVYTLNGYIVTSENVAGSNVVSLFSEAGATGTGYGAIHTNATSGTQNLGAGVSVTFKAASSTLYVNASLVTVIIGNNSPNETYLTITENNTAIETDQF